MPPRVLAVALAGLLAAAVPTLARGNAPGILVAREPGGPAVVTVGLKIAGDATTTSTPLYLQATGPAELAGVRLLATLNDPSGQPASGVTVTFQASGADLPAAGLRLPAGKQVAVTLRVANLSAVGQLRGVLLAEHKDQFLRLATLTVERYPVPVLRVAGAAEPAGVKLTCNEPRLRHLFRIESVNQAPVEALQVSVAPLVGPTSTQVPVTWKVDGRPGGKPVAVPGLGAVEVEVSAPLILTGAYAGLLTLVYADRRETVSFTVTRARPPLAVEVLGLEAARATSCCGRGDATLWLTVSAGEGQDVTLDPPALTALALKGANQAKSQSTFDRLAVLTEDGEDCPDPLTVKAGTTVRLKLIVRGLRDTGEHTGTVRLAASDAQPIDRPVTILMKDSGWVAGGLIFLGVSFSFLIRLWVRTGQPYLLRVQRAQDLLAELNQADGQAGLEDAERAVLRRLRERVDEVAGSLTRGSASGADATLDDVAAKLGLFRTWVEARRLVDAVQPATIAGPFREILRAVEGVLLSPAGEGVDDARKKLKDLPAQVEDAVKRDLADRIQAVEREVAAQRTALPPDLADRLDREVVAPLAEARRHADAGDRDQARALLETARRADARLLADQLKRELTAAARPAWFAQAAWDAMLAQVNAYADQALQAAGADEAVTHYQRAYRLYLNSLAVQLRTEIDQLADQINHERTFDDATKKGFLDRLAPLIPRLDGVREKAAADTPASRLAGVREYRAVEAVVSQVAQEVSQAVGGTLAATGAAGATQAALPAGGGLPGIAVGGALPAVSAPPSQRRISLARVGTILRVLSWAFQPLVLLIAVLLGLRLLWVDDPTWGGWTAYLNAILWGLGLHQVSGAAFEGVEGLVAKLAK
jgi:hypothetical protein